MGKSVSNGVLHGLGNGVVMSTEGDVASYTGKGIGKIDSSETVHWRGSLFYKSSSNGKLASLNNVVVVLEASKSFLQTDNIISYPPSLQDQNLLAVVLTDGIHRGCN
jgi:hypothetical protein